MLSISNTLSNKFVHIINTTFGYTVDLKSDVEPIFTVPGNIDMSENVILKRLDIIGNDMIIQHSLSF